MTDDVKPRELRAASFLLWTALAAGIAGSVVAYASPDEQESSGILEIALDAAFVVITAVVTYFFSMARNWARIASLVLFVLTLLGLMVVPSLFARSPPAGWLYVSQAIMQAIAMYLAYATPASNAFRHTSTDDVALRAVLPVGRSGWAIAAGYLALFSVLLIPAPFALACGLMGMRDIKRHPEKHGMGRAIFGVVMGALGVTVSVILFLIRQPSP